MRLTPLSSRLAEHACGPIRAPQRRRARRSSLMWPLKVRVGANSPSLCPTIASLTKTGTCLRPSCTAMVWPIMSGMTVERRDQVLMTCLLPASLCASTFLSRWSSMNGPFFRLRGIVPPSCSALLASTAATDDQLVAGLTTPGTAFGLARRVHRVTPTGGFALTATVRVIDRVHHHTANRGSLALPAHPAGLAPVDVALFGVSDLTHRGATPDIDIADLAGRHPQLAVGTVFGHQLNPRPSRAGDLRAATGTELDRVHHRADRDIAQRQVVARLDVGLGAVLHHVTLTQFLRGDDVSLLTVDVVQQRDPGGTVRVVLDVRDLGRHAVLVCPPEIDEAVSALVPATLVAGRDPAVDVASAPAVQGTDQRLLRVTPGDLGEVGDT